MKNEGRLSSICFTIFFALISITIIYPVLLVIGTSLSSDSSIIANGYRVIPSEFSLEAYKYMSVSGDRILAAYGRTIFNAVVGTILSVTVVSLYAYPLSRNDFRHKKFFTFYIFFTMLFSGGLVPWYMVLSTILGLQNNTWGLILPYLMSTWHVIIMRTFFQITIPDSLVEAAKIDGAGEYKIFYGIVMPLSLPGIATISLFTTLTYWNDWWLPLMLTSQPDYWNLQFLLQNMIRDIQMLITMSSEMGSSGSEMLRNMPADAVRMALCVIAMGPIIAVYPFFQKYFIKGLTVGSVKG